MVDTIVYADKPPMIFGVSAKTSTWTVDHVLPHVWLNVVRGREPDTNSCDHRLS